MLNLAEMFAATHTLLGDFKSHCYPEGGLNTSITAIYWCFRPMHHYAHKSL